MTFLLWATALLVEPEWLEYSRMTVSYGRKECPTHPVAVNNVYFSRSILDVLGIASGLGRRDFLLHVQGLPVSQNEPQTFPAPANRVPGQPVEASIEMSKIPEMNAKFSNQGRRYSIHYSTSDQTMAGDAEIICGSDGVRRVCTGPRRRFAGLLVNYSVSQDQFPASEEASTDPSTEAGTILQFDQRLRQWLIGLERPG
jgi:hypothetical protein